MVVRVYRCYRSYISFELYAVEENNGTYGYKHGPHVLLYYQRFFQLLLYYMQYRGLYIGPHYITMTSLIARFMRLTWGPSGADRTQVGPMLAPWILLSWLIIWYNETNSSTSINPITLTLLVLGSEYSGGKGQYYGSLSPVFLCRQVISSHNFYSVESWGHSLHWGRI